MPADRSCFLVPGTFVFEGDGMRIVVNIRKMASVRAAADTKTVQIRCNKRNRPVSNGIGLGSAAGKGSLLL